MPKVFTKVMKNGVPFYTVFAVSMGILIGALLNAILPLVLMELLIVSLYMYIVPLFWGMIPWFMILFSHLRFRRLHPEKVHNHPFKMPGGNCQLFNYHVLL